MKKTKKLKNMNKLNVRSKNRMTGKPYYMIVLVLWGLYVYLLFFAPNTSATQLNLSPQAINLIRVTVAVPYLLTWLAAAYSLLKIKKYALEIKPSPESIGFGRIANGVFILLISLVSSTLISSLRTFLVYRMDTRPILTILTNYAYVLPYLIAFIFLFRGTLVLARQHQESRISHIKYLIFGLPLFVFAYYWLELIFTNPTRMVAGSGSQFATYYLRDSLLILTIVIPSFITWVMGLRTMLKLWIYHNQVKGFIYKHALSSFVYGFTGVILGSVFLQALLSLGAQRLLNLGLTGILELIYLFIFIQLLGFFLIAKGARKLARIEEV